MSDAFSKISFKAFIVLQAVIYLSFLVIDITKLPGFENLSCLLKYIGIIACFSFVDSRNFFIKLAMFFTLFADFFLIFTTNYAIGVCFFTIVQLLYCYYFSGCRLHTLLVEAAVSLLISFFSYLIAGGVVNIDFLWLISVFYYCILLQNIILTFLKRMWLPFSGLILMALCDLNVGLFNIGTYIAHGSSFSGLFLSVTGVLMWFFYLPSQVIIASCFRRYQSSCIFPKDLV